VDLAGTVQAGTAPDGTVPAGTAQVDLEGTAHADSSQVGSTS
jgi:hypothetical protein